MKQEFREKVKDIRRKIASWRISGKDIWEQGNVRDEMRFDEPEDVDFDLMDFYFYGRLKQIIRHAKLFAKMYKSLGRAYEEFKPYITDYVGHFAYSSEELHPMLHSSKAYDLVLDRLYEACNEGENERRAEETSND